MRFFCSCYNQEKFDIQNMFRNSSVTMGEDQRLKEKPGRTRDLHVNTKINFSNIKPAEERT